VGPFLWDATYTLFFRIVNREDWLHPHRRHLFQRLAVSGWSHGSVRTVYFALAGATAIAAVALPILSGGAALALLGAAVAACVAVAAAAQRAERRATLKQERR